MNGQMFLQVLLIMDGIGMAALAAFYLARRRMAWYQYLGWGLVAALVPLLGPFLVIASRPGQWRAKVNRLPLRGRPSPASR